MDPETTAPRPTSVDPVETEQPTSLLNEYILGMPPKPKIAFLEGPPKPLMPALSIPKSIFYYVVQQIWIHPHNTFKIYLRVQLANNLRSLQCAEDMRHLTTELALQVASADTRASEDRLRVGTCLIRMSKTEGGSTQAVNGQQKTHNWHTGSPSPPSYEEKLLEVSRGFI